MSEVLINPAARLLGEANAILSGRGVRRYESRFVGPLSVKSVMRGSATWETAQGRFELAPGAALVLNDGEEYTITVDHLQPVETFCLFFRRGFIEDAWSATTTSSARLLDRETAWASIVFAERLHFDPSILARLSLAHRAMSTGEELADAFYCAALELIRTRGDIEGRVAKLPALRASTRSELARRLEMATSYLHANLERRVSIADAAHQASLSPFHFHRLFRAFHGVTPHQYLTRLRLDLARTLLRGSDRPVVDVAVACGFDSVTSFTTLFKKTFGAAPARYRNLQDSRSAPQRRALPFLNERAYRGDQRGRRGEGDVAD